MGHDRKNSKVQPKEVDGSKIWNVVWVRYFIIIAFMIELSIFKFLVQNPCLGKIKFFGTYPYVLAKPLGKLRQYTKPFCFDIENGSKNIFLGNKTFLFFKIEI